MTKPFCDCCNAPLDEMPRLMIPQMIMVNGNQSGQVQGLHFCSDDNHKCLFKWLDKNTKRPMILTPNGPAQ